MTNVLTPGTQDLNVASDATTIYEGGRLIPVSIDDLKGNAIALRQLVNTLNLANRQIDDLKGEVERLKLERAAFVAQPAVAVFLTSVNVCGAILIALGVNYLTAQPAVPGAGWIAGIGAVLTLVTAAAPVLMPVVVDFFLRRENAH